MTKLSNTKYAKYIKDRMNAEILEDDTGFIIYSFINKDECFIHEMSVVPAICGQGYGKQLIAELEDISLHSGRKYISAHVQLWDKGAPNTLTAAFKTGFELATANQTYITILKKLGGI